MKKIFFSAALFFCALLLLSCKETALPADAIVMAETEDTDTDASTSSPQTEEAVSKTAPASTDEVWLDVENILQMPQLPNGCEIVSLAIVLQYMFETEIDPVWLSDNYLPKGTPGQADPEYTYVGDPKGYGFGCYVPCLQMAAIRYLVDTGIRDYTAKDISGSSMGELEEWVAEGTPVIMWATVNMEPTVVAQEWTIWGQTVRWYSGSHCVVLSGYTEDTSIICDPLRGVIEYDRQDVIEAYRLVGERAMVLYQPR